MRNPLWKRLPRELRQDMGKQIAIFVFLVLMIGLCSGEMLAGDSMKQAYEESFEKYHVEDGYFELLKQPSKELISKLEESGVTVYENFYVEKKTENASKLRLYQDREYVDLVCLMQGKLPTADDEVALDRLYAVNNHLAIGDTITMDGEEWIVTGYVALSDYSALFEKHSEMMFDASMFGVGIVAKPAWERLSKQGFHYRYAWTYHDAPENEMERAQQLMEEFTARLGIMEKLFLKINLTAFVPAYANPAIQFSGTDIGKDSAMIEVLLYILIVLLSFVFAITCSNTIVSEASVIGTLRASGYTRMELVCHYMSLPLMVTFLGAVAGNILGYTVFKDLVAKVYYNSYSLTTYVTIWNARVFLQTTLIPMVIMTLINFVMLLYKLSLSPLRFLRHDLSRSGKKRAMSLPKLSFFSRFRLRIIGQNLSGYITMFVGIVFANVLLAFGMVLPSMISRMQDKIQNNIIANYQYVLTDTVKDAPEGAEAYCAGALETIAGYYASEEIMVFGIRSDSQYMKYDVSSHGVYITDGYAKKFQVKVGDEITLCESNGKTLYQFQVEGIFEYPSALAICMRDEMFWQTFERERGEYNGYFADEELEEIDERIVANVITETELTKVSRQLKDSMGDLFYLFDVISVALFLLVVYLLSKLILERNANAISMVKILGYEEKEIALLYLLSTGIVVFVSILMSLPILSWIISKLVYVIMQSFTGWFDIELTPVIYVKTVIIGMISYSALVVMQYRKLKRIPMADALKHVE